MLTFHFSGTRGCMTEPETLTSGMVGKTLLLDLSADWDDLLKTVVFSNGSITRDVLYTGNPVIIPAQIMETPLKKLSVGIYGTSSDGALVIPTIRVEGPVILPGVDPSGDPGTKPDLPVWAQVLGLIGDTENLTTEAKDSLVSAINEAARTGSGGGESGGYYTPEITQPEAGVMRISFVPSQAGMEQIDPVDIPLPAGKDGQDGEDGAPGENAAADISLGVTGASVGQVVKISAVDENGVPTGWEPADMAAGGEKPWRLVNSVTLTEEAAKIEFLTDSEGNPFELKKILVLATTVGASGNTGAGYVYYNSMRTTTEGRIGLTPSGIASAGTKSFIKMVGEIMHDRIHVMGSNRAVDSASDVTMVTFNTPYTWDHGFTTLSLTTSKGMFGVGTKVELLGVDM